MKDRLQKFIESQALSAARFADEIGVQRSAVSHILSDRNKPGYDFIYKILSRFKQLNAEWLILGTGPMLKDFQQTKLFPNDEENKAPETSINAPVSTLINNTNPKPDSAVQDEDPGPYKVKEKVGSKKLEKIIFFYSDKTFTQFHPNDI